MSTASSRPYRTCVSTRAETIDLLNAVAAYGRMIKFSHSIFALPFALSGAALGATVRGITPTQIGWIAVAMVLVLISSAVLILAAYRLNTLCLYLSPVALLVLFSYSYTKRFTWVSHLVLGLSLGLAPVGAWIAVTGSIGIAPILLGIAVLTWVAGFDILYACQDHDFDTRAGLHSIPVRFGLRRSLTAARVLHGLTVAFMFALSPVMDLSGLYLTGVALIAGLLIYEHRLVRPEDLTKVNTAFMTMNSIVSIVFFTFTVADLLLLGDRSLVLV